MSGAVPTYDLYGENHPKRPDFWLHWETIASRSQLHNWEIKTHRHAAFFEILSFRGGTGDAVFGAHSHPIQPPVMITVPPQCEHGFRFSRDMDGMVITMLAARFGSSGRTICDAGMPPRLISLVPDHADAAFLTHSLERLCAELVSGGAFHDDLVESYLKSIVLLAARMTAPELPPGGGQPAFSRTSPGGILCRTPRLVGNPSQPHRQGGDGAEHQWPAGAPPCRSGEARSGVHLCQYQADRL